MNKADLISIISEETGITKQQANAALDSFTNAVTKALKSGKKVTLVDFGTFSVLQRVERVGRNPQLEGSNAKIIIKAKKVAKFKAGKLLNASVA